MRRLSILTLALGLLVALPASAGSPRVNIKLGTMAPDGSTWHLLLKQMGEEWAKVSNGTVRLRIFPGGVAGNEGDMVRKMRIGQLQAAALTVVGLHDIEQSAQAISTPGMITNDEEWKYVFEKMQPRWEPRFVEKGFVPLMWGDTGWVYMFFNKPLKPSQMKGAKVFAWAGDPASVKAWEAAGFQPVVISATDILPSLTTGMIEGFAQTPVMAFSARYFEQAKYMIDAAWGHLPGSTVIRKETWEKIPADLRPKLMAIAREYGDKVNAEVNKMQADSITQMKKAGLQVIELDEAERKTHAELAKKTWPVMRGGVVSEADFDEIKALVDEFRAGKGNK
jgi:TRAP-type C4-dicarboxylate transport system substrate-binding protein